MQRPLSMVRCTGRPTMSDGQLLGGRLRAGLADDLAPADDRDPVGDGRTSRSLWVMKTIEVPLSRSSRMTRIRSSVSCGVSTAVGSSRMSTLASCISALTISTRCWMPTGQVSDERVGRDRQAVALGDLGHVAPGPPAVQEAEGLGVLVAEGDVLGDGEDGDQHEVLVHHADAGRHRVARTLEGDRLAVDQDLAPVGLVEPVEHVHQRALAGAVLAEQGVDLAGLDRQVDGVVGDEACRTAW